MKIENNGSSIPPLSSKPTEAATRVEKKEDRKDLQTARIGQDTAEMSENARLLAKARVALGNVDETNTDRVVMLKAQVASGDYTIKVSDLARKLVAKLYPK
jgi:flagellar biosynthesis anti-sigma factor FlgM